uniref:general transcription factor 3C polypeptide 1-like isoform X2 n=1 Tax=Myxine glutinosa TaxID=7769 RepID=UPI00358F88C2
MFKRLYQQVVDSGKAAMVTVPGSQIRPEIKRTKTAKGMVRCLQLLSNGDHNLCVKGCGGVSSGVRDVHIEDGDDMDDSMDGCGAIPSHRLIYERDTLSQAYDVVRASGPEGISQSKLQRALRVDKLEGRMLCRTMDRHLLVKGIMEDEGRQRTTKFVAMEFVDCSELNLMFQREKARGHELGLVSPNSEKSPPFIPKPPSALPKPPSALPKPRGRPRGSTKARGAGQKKNKNARGRGRGRGVKEREEIINVGQMSLEDFPGNGDGAPANYITLTDVSLFESAEDGSSEALHSTQANRIPMDDNKGLSGSSEDNVGLIGPFKNSLAPSDLSEDIVGPCGIIGNTKEQFNAYFNAEDLKSSGRDVKEEVWMGQSQREVLNPVEALMRITALEMDGNVNTAEGPFITEETSLVKSVVEEEDVKDPKSQVPSPMDGKEIENVEEEIAGEKPNAENMAGKEEPEGVPVEEVMIQNNERGQSAKKRCKSNPGAGNKETYRLLRRQNLILEAIGSHRLIEGVFTLQKIIGDAEKSEGVGTKCCRKSVLRLVQRLAAEHLLRIYHTTILQDDAQHKVELIAHPSVSPKDPLMRSTLQQIRFRFSTLQHARKVSEEADQTHDAETTSHGEGNNSAEDGSPKKVLSAVHRQSHFCGMERRMGVPPLRNYKPTIVPGHGRDLGFQAKMPRLRTLHTFIWYIVYGHLEHNDRSSEAARAVKCGNDKAVGENQLGMSLDETPADGSQGGEIPDPKEKRPFSSDPAEVLVETSYAEEWQKEYAEEKLYVDETGWKRFVPPGPVHNDYGPGWIMIGDLFFCMPLSIFINLVQISYKVDNLEEYLNHPFRRNTLIRFLPLEMRQKLLHKRKYLASVFESIQRLCYMGLLQFGPADKYQERDQIFVYVKRHGTVMDTTMCEPHNKLARSTQPFPHHMYSFVVLQDVDNYWLHLQCVCLNTPLGIIRSTRKNCRLALFEDVEDGDSSSHCSLDKKCFGLHFTMGTKDIVDDGAVPGDGCGAGGLDSTFFGHLKRNWIWVSYIVASKNQGRPNRDKSTSIRLQTLLQKPSLSLMFLHNNEGQSGRGISGAWSPNVQAEEVAVRQVSRKDCDRKGGRGLKRKRLQKVVVRKPRKCARQEAKCTSGDGRPQVRLDEADRNAVDRMTKQRVSWTAHEDGLLLLCCVASAVLNSKVHRPFVSWQVIRDISHANFENSLDKTSHAVARRVRNILKNRESELNLRVCLAEVCQDRVLIEDFLSRQENYDIAKVCEAEYKELVEKLRSKFEHSDSSTGPMLPESLEELHQRFTMLDVSRRPEDLVMKDLQSVEDIQETVLENFILSSLMLSEKQRRPHYPILMFSLYKQYPEALLFRAFCKFKQHGLVNRRRRNHLEGIKKDRALPFAPMSYQLSQSYFKFFMWRFPGRTCSDAFAFIERLCHVDNDHQPDATVCLRLADFTVSPREKDLWQKCDTAILGSVDPEELSIKQDLKSVCGNKKPGLVQCDDRQDAMKMQQLVQAKDQNVRDDELNVQMTVTQNWKNEVVGEMLRSEDIGERKAEIEVPETVRHVSTGGDAQRVETAVEYAEDEVTAGEVNENILVKKAKRDSEIGKAGKDLDTEITAADGGGIERNRTEQDPTFYSIDAPGGSCMAVLELMSMGLLQVELKVPDDIVVVDSMMVDNTVLKRQQSDSDEEDEDDEEEEEEYEGEKPKPRHSSRSWPIISAQLSSRVNYLLLRGCYMPGIGSVKGTNRSDNVVVNACQIRFGLRHSRAPYGLAPSTDARGNSYKVELAAAGLPLWFKKKRNAIDQECAQNTEVEMTVNESITSASLSTTVLSVVEQAGDIGLPLTALMQAVGFLGQIQELQDCVQDLLTQGALLEVGRSVPHLVCQSKARAWLIDLHRKQTAVHGSDIGESHSATKRCHNSDCDSPVSKRKVTAGNRAEDETPGNSAVDQQGPRTSEERVMDSQESFVLERIEELGKQLTEDAVTPVELPGNVCETSSLRDKPEHDNPNTCTDVLTEEVEKRKESLARILESFDASTLSDSQTSYIPRPWRIVDGTLNLPVCKGLLESLMYHIMTRPGITRRDLQNHYHLVLHPFILLEILKAVPESRRPPNGSPSPCVGSVNSRRRLLPMRGPKLSPPPAHVPCPTRVLEDAGCICKRHLLSCTRPSLFSQPTCPREFSLSPKPVESPSSTSPSVALLGEPESCTTFYEPIVDGVLKLAQLFPTENYWSKWLTYIHS